MRRIKVIAGVLHVSQGARLGLSKAQAAPRAHNLDRLKGEKGLFVAKAPLQFKAGEVLSVEDIGRAQLGQVEFLDVAAAADLG